MCTTQGIIRRACICALFFCACTLLVSCAGTQETGQDDLSSAPYNFLAESIDDARVPSSVQKEIEAQKHAEEKAAQEAAWAAQDISVQLNSALLLEAIPTSKEVNPFSINAEREAPELAPDEAQAILDAAHTIEDAGYACSALLLDVQSGRGLAYNADEAIYTASTFKAALSSYLLENNLTTGWDLGNIEASILYSDNDAFEALATAHMDAAYQEWLAQHGIEYDAWSPWYPNASAKSMASCWLDIFHYVDSGDEQAVWFGDLLANTNISFIRNALEGLEVSVQNKAGWLTDYEFGNSVSDCAIVRANGRAYLLVVMSNQPSWEEAHERVQNLARALFNCCKSLN